MARILVVDDDADVLRVVEQVLSVNEHVVFTASDAVKAMDLLNSSLFDLLISDANMPGFSGFDLIRTIRNNRRFEKMGIAMLTSLREKKYIQKAIRAGVDDYIVKPIEPEVLLRKIETLFEKRPPMGNTELEIPEDTRNANARFTTEVKVKRISELGINFKSKVEYPEGMIVEVKADIFRKIGVEPPAMRVLSSVKLAEFEYEVRAAFVGLTDKTISDIRAWIASQPNNRNAA